MTKPNLNNINGNFIPPEVLSNNLQASEITDLNEILQSVLDKYSVEQQNNFICRFDKLPLVYGDREHYICLFDALISMIISHPPHNSKLFLYVRCAEAKEDNEIIDLRPIAGTILCKIDIYSNITTDKNWEVVYQNKLTECALQATKNSGSFSFSPISNTGCLFSVTLPGKIN